MSVKDFCTTLDLMDKNAKTKSHVDLVLNNCLTSLFSSTNKKTTFLAPVGAALTELKKLKGEELKVQLRRHLMFGVHNPASIKSKTSSTLISNVGDKYPVAASGASSIVLEIGAGNVDADFVADSRNGALYTINKLLPAAKTAHRAASKGSRKSSHSKKTSRKQTGGGFLEEMNGGGCGLMKGGYGLRGLNMNDNDLDMYMMKRNNPIPMVRHRIIEDYARRMNPDLWAKQLYATILLYLRENMPDFDEIALPFLSTDAFAGIESLFQRFDVPWNESNALIPTSIFDRFMESPTYMSMDPGLLGNGRSYLTSILNQAPIGSGMFSNLHLWQQLANSQRNIIKNLLESPEKPLMRKGILSVYRKMYGEPNRFNPNTEALYTKIMGPKLPERMLKTHLMQFIAGKMGNRVPFGQYNTTMRNLFGHPLDDTLRNILEYDKGTGTLYNFNDQFFDMFVNSPLLGYNPMGDYMNSINWGETNFIDLGEGLWVGQERNFPRRMPMMQAQLVAIEPKEQYDSFINNRQASFF